jgi:hypothetical protein
MPANYVLLERIELNASAASVTFASIPQTGYTDLKIVAAARTDTTTPNIMITLNGSTSSFTNKVVYGTGSSALSTSYARFVGYASMSTDTASTFGNSEIYIPNYSGSTNKSFSSDAVHENNATAANAGLSAGLWSNTAAITSVGLSPDSGNFVANSTFSLYGLAAVGTTPVIAPKASGGNIIDFDGTYWIHTFLTSGTFTPQTTLSCDYLVVAGGGGGGGSRSAGGGGAGGYLTSIGGSPLSISTAQTVTVGAGGAGQTDARGLVGNDSQFGSLTLVKGGGYGGAGTDGAAPQIGGNGGSGGGGGGWGSANAGGTALGTQGNAGSAAATAPNYPAGAGGGAGAAGATITGSSTSSAAGGAGLANSISGTSVTYAGGGGGGASPNATTGGAGGSGGGGAGGNTTVNGNPGTANTGGGGGGSGRGFVNPGIGGAGGSGIVIIRYLAT